MKAKNSCILVTGANGFIGKNLIIRLNEINNISTISFTRENKQSDLDELVSQADAVIHLAAENRPDKEKAFLEVNINLTRELCSVMAKHIKLSKRKIPLIFTSSIQSKKNNPYGKSKLGAEKIIKEFSQNNNNPCKVFQLPGVFGKWCKPNYNSVVATFCHNIARNLPIKIDDENKVIDLVYIDDVIDAITSSLSDQNINYEECRVNPIYSVSLMNLADQIKSFFDNNNNLIISKTSEGFYRALYATYINNLPQTKFLENISQHKDTRGKFVEFLKTNENGQFSYFTCLPGKIRGNHYHHTKTEKFIVIQGEALFCFRNLVTNEKKIFYTDGNSPQIVNTIPGWAHYIENVGKNELLVMLWANEIFDANKPDTITCKV